DGLPVVPVPLPSYNGFDSASFDRYSSFWSTASGAPGSSTRKASVLQGRGLADFSNRAFFTEGTNFGSSAALQYGPSNNREDYREDKETFFDLLAGLVPVRFLFSKSPETSGMRATSESVFSRFLPKQSPLYTMNRYVFDDHADRLLPQAIRYSWGLLDRFFRGRIDCRLFSAYPTGCLVRNRGPEAIGGTFELFYDDVDGMRRAVPGTRTADKVILDGNVTYPLGFV